MEEWKQKLREARERKQLTKTAFAKAVGVSNATATDWEKGSDVGGIKEISGVKLMKVCEVLGIEAVWLLSSAVASKNMQPKATVPFDENVRPVPMGSRPIPVISAVQAGALRDMECPYEPGDGYAVEYTDDLKLSRWTFGLDVEGDSMMPRFQPGDRLIVDPEREPKPGNFVIARNGSDQATFKKYRPRGINAAGNMIFELVPLNDDYPTLRSDLEYLVIIGVVTEVKQKLV